MQNIAALDHYAGAQARSRQDDLLRARPPFAYVYRRLMSRVWKRRLAPLPSTPRSWCYTRPAHAADPQRNAEPPIRVREVVRGARPPGGKNNWARRCSSKRYRAASGQSISDVLYIFAFRVALYGRDHLYFPWRTCPKSHMRILERLERGQIGDSYDTHRLENQCQIWRVKASPPKVPPQATACKKEARGLCNSGCENSFFMATLPQPLISGLRIWEDVAHRRWQD